MIELGAIKKGWEMGNPIDGSPMLDISITTGGRTYPILLYSEAADEERTIIVQVLKEV
jgi:hypothetical protein